MFKVPCNFLEEIISLLSEIGKYEIVDEGGFPDESMRAVDTIGSAGSCVVPVSLEDNVIWLHEFLFEDGEYVPSTEVKTYSNKVYSDTSPYLN